MKASRALLLLLSLLVACGKDDSAGKPASRAEPPPPDFARIAMTRVDDAIVDGPAFSIELPADLDRDATTNYVNWTFRGNPFLLPSITVQRGEPFTMPNDLAAAVERATMLSQDKPPIVVTTQQALTGGFLVTTQRGDEQFLHVEAHLRKGDVVVSCSVIHRTGIGDPGDQPIASFAATKAWAEKTCASLQLR